jgi:hypothetical protein
MQRADGVDVSARYANTTVQELIELAEQLPFVVHISSGGARMELVESQPKAPPAPAADPVEPSKPKRPRGGRKPGPKPKQKLPFKPKAPTKGPLSIPCKAHNAAVGKYCLRTALACRERRRAYREGAKGAQVATSKTAAIPRRMKELRGKPLSDIGLKVRELLEKGKSIKEISIEVGRPYATVWNHAKAYRKTKSKQAARPPAAPLTPAQPAPVPVGAAPVGTTPPAAAPPAPKVSKATASTHAIAERIARGEPLRPTTDASNEPEMTIAPPLPTAEPVDLNLLTNCPHCGESLSKSRYGRTVCRNDACDLWGRFVDQGEAKEGCNCERCTLLRVAEAADIEENGGIVAEAQDA